MEEILLVIKDILFILIYLYVAGFIIFGLNGMIRFHTKIANLVKKSKNCINNNSSKVRDYAVIIACICAVVAMIVALIMLNKIK